MPTSSSPAPNRLTAEGSGTTVTQPNTFVIGTIADADQVNANFNAVKTAVDDNDARVTVLESGGALIAGANGTNFTTSSNGLVEQSAVISVNAPAAGFVMLVFDGTAELYDNDFGDLIRVGIGQGNIFSGVTQDLFIPSNNLHWLGFSVTRVLPCVAGANTFQGLVRDAGAGDQSGVFVSDPHLTAVFIPGSF